MGVNGISTRFEQERPYPYDALIGGMPVMLADPGDGVTPWHEEQAKFFDQLVALSAEDRSYAQWPPDVEFPWAVTDLIEGMGQSDQSPTTRRRYSHTTFADASSGKPVCAPRMTEQTGLGGSVVSVATFAGDVYAAVGKKIWKRISDAAGGASWSQVGSDLPFDVSGQMAVFQGTAATAYLFIPQGQGHVYYVLSPTGVYTAHGSRDAVGFCAHGSELWLHTVEGNQQTVRKSEDGGTAATWAAATITGDAARRIKRLMSVADELIALKEDGPYGYDIDAATVDVPLAPELADSAGPENGTIALAWNGRLVFNHAGNLLSYDVGDGSLSPIGPEILEANRSPIKGPISSIAHHQGICLFGTITTAAGDTELLRYGSWELQTTERGVMRAFLPAWHGSLYTWTGRTAVASHITACYGAAPRLYVFFSDGGVAWCRLARTSNVTDDPTYEYDASHEGYIYLPRWTAGFTFESKLLKGIGLHGRDLLGGTRVLGVAYKSAESETWLPLGTVTSDPGERLNLASGAPGRAIDVRASVRTYSTTTTPTLVALVLYSALRLEGLRVITALVKAGEGVVDHLGRPLHHSWRETRENLEASMTTAGAVSVVAPSGAEYQVIGLSYAHDLAGRDPRSKAQRWVETVKMVETRRISTRGTWGRLAAYTWGDLAALTWADTRQL